VARVEACLRAKFLLDPSNCFATISVTDRQTGQDNGPIAYDGPFYKRLPKNGWGKTSNLSELPPTCCQSEAFNFRTAKHINKQKPGVSSMINALKNYARLGGITAQDFDAS